MIKVEHLQAVRTVFNIAIGATSADIQRTARNALLQMVNTVVKRVSLMNLVNSQSSLNEADTHPVKASADCPYLPSTSSTLEWRVSLSAAHQGQLSPVTLNAICSIKLVRGEAKGIGSDPNPVLSRQKAFTQPGSHTFSDSWSKLRLFLTCSRGGPLPCSLMGTSAWPRLPRAA